MTLASWPRRFSYSATLGLRGVYKWEHADTRSDEQQYQISTIMMRTSGVEMFNSRRTVGTNTKIAGTAAGVVYWVAATALSMRAWAFTWLKKRVWAATSQRRLLSVVDIA